MINYISNFDPDQVFKADICIIGAGAAGIDIARFFNGKNYSVLLIESGDLKFDWKTQSFYAMKVIGKSIRGETYQSNSPTGKDIGRECRIRQFGGTTNIWSGKWKQLETIDFQSKDWIPNSGWPISYNDLLPLYEEVAKDYNISDTRPHLHSNWATGITNKLFGYTEDIKYTIHYEEKSPTNFNSCFFEELKQSKNIIVLLKANLHDIILEDNYKKVKSAHIRTLENKNYYIKAEVFILACGGLENARLLLNANSQINTGIGNSKDLVGRFYMDHPKGIFGVIKPYRKTHLVNVFYNDTRQNNVNLIGFSISNKRQFKHKTLNHSFSLQPVYKNKSNLYSRLIKTLRAKEVHEYQIMHYLEQAPNYKSRVFLDKETDVLGKRKLVIDWQLSTLDKESFKNYIQQLQEIYKRTKIGEIIFDRNYQELEFLHDASHHMGTTRMAQSPREGVVDLNCQVFGIDNLYIAGSSVFPTGGNANPTYTILALSRRLCQYLEKVQLGKLSICL